MRPINNIPGLCGVVILYHPDGSVADNIRTYAGNLEKLWVFDNTECGRQDLSFSFESEKNIEWVRDGVNKGIGSRINMAIERALEAGYTWLLTMDQDSSFTPENWNAYAGAVAKLDTRNRRIAMLGVGYSHETQASTGAIAMREELRLVTSGSLIHLAAIQEIGGMNEDLFIDEIDSDFVYRAWLAGWEVLQCDGVYMVHQLGDRKQVRSLKTGRWSNRGLHSPLRLYYITRNFLWIKKKYGSRLPGLFMERTKRLLNMYKNNLFYNPQRFQALWMIWKGYRDFRRNRTGKLNDRNQ